jgi:hypothetical protein
VADALGDGGRPVADVALSVGPTLMGWRVLRLLESRGLFVSDGDVVGRSAASQFLRTDHPASLAAFVRMLAQSIQWQRASCPTSASAAPQRNPHHPARRRPSFEKPEGSY